MLSAEKRSPGSSPASRPRPRTAHLPRAALPIVPGYTVLVIDTNILLSSLPMFARLVESLRWTLVLPLPVIMELDGLSSTSNRNTPLGEAAVAAVSYIDSHVRSHSAALKVQTSKGNYLPNLNIRTEQVDFADGEATWERNMDDLILRAAMWQREHWVDRSAFLEVNSASEEEREREVEGAAKVVLLSFDRNCESLVHFGEAGFDD